MYQPDAINKFDAPLNIEFDVAGKEQEATDRFTMHFILNLHSWKYDMMRVCAMTLEQRRELLRSSLKEGALIKQYQTAHAMKLETMKHGIHLRRGRCDRVYSPLRSTDDRETATTGTTAWYAF